MNTQTLFFAGLCLTITNSFSAILPADLLYHGKAIDPLCFTNPSETADTIHLKDCGITAEGASISGHDKTLEKKGFYGYEFKYQQNDPIHAYSYYKVITQTNKKTLIYTLSSGGGSGSFTALSLLSRQGDTMHMQTIAGGDRCNNGINHVTFKGNILRYSINITPFDFIALSAQNPHKIKAYDDLLACASCCAATVIIKRSIQDGLTNEQIEKIDFRDYNLNARDYPNTMPYQACFDKLIKQYISEGQGILTLKGLNAFVKNFNLSCTK